VLINRVKSITTFFVSSRRRHTRFSRDWSSDVCSSDLGIAKFVRRIKAHGDLHNPACGVTEAADDQQRRIRFVVTQESGDVRRKRSEERRVGKESRARWTREREKKSASAWSRGGGEGRL